MQAVSYVDITKPVTTLDAKNEVSFAGWQHPVHTVCTHQSQERKADHGFPGKEQQDKIKYQLACDKSLCTFVFITYSVLCI